MKDGPADDDMTLEIPYHWARRLRNKEAASGKIWWRSKSVDGSTCE